MTKTAYFHTTYRGNVTSCMESRKHLNNRCQMNSCEYKMSLSLKIVYIVFWSSYIQQIPQNNMVKKKEAL